MLHVEPAVMSNVWTTGVGSIVVSIIVVIMEFMRYVMISKITIIDV